MQRTKNKKNETLLCTYGKCEKPQGEDGEYCDKHYPKLKQTEYNKIIDALNVIDEQAEYGNSEISTETKERLKAYELVAKFIDKHAKR